MIIGIATFAVAAESALKTAWKNPVAVISTSMGDIRVGLFADVAPKTVSNCIGLAEGTKSFKNPITV